MTPARQEPHHDLRPEERCTYVDEFRTSGAVATKEFSNFSPKEEPAVPPQRSQHSREVNGWGRGRSVVTLFMEPFPRVIGSAADNSNFGTFFLLASWYAGCLPPDRRGHLRVLATHYRRRAQACLEIARASVGEKRILLLDMAQTWFRLAEEEEVSIPPSPAEHPQPIVQQQQVQPPEGSGGRTASGGSGQPVGNASGTSGVGRSASL
jgi:hypothetical protein